MFIKFLKTKKLLFSAKRGSALVLTMFILAGMLIVAMSGAYVVFLGIKAAGIQSQSAKAYYGAEAGAEQLLWEFRKSAGGVTYGGGLETPVLTGGIDEGADYEVYYIQNFSPVIFHSIGQYMNTKRSVEIRIGG